FQPNADATQAHGRSSPKTERSDSYAASDWSEARGGALASIDVRHRYPRRRGQGNDHGPFGRYDARDRLGRENVVGSEHGHTSQGRQGAFRPRQAGDGRHDFDSGAE